MHCLHLYVYIPSIRCRLQRRSSKSRSFTKQQHHPKELKRYDYLYCSMHSIFHFRRRCIHVTVVSEKRLELRHPSWYLSHLFGLEMHEFFAFNLILVLTRSRLFLIFVHIIIILLLHYYCAISQSVQIDVQYSKTVISDVV
jgi:hypothetical protein